MARLIGAAVAAAILLAGCGGGDGRTQLRLQVFADPDEARAYQRLIDAFERRDGRTEVELIAVGDQGDHQTKLSTAFAAGSPPDLFLINYRRFGQFAARGVLQPLEGWVPTDGLYDVAVGAFRFDGRLQCVPQNVSTPVVYLNTRLFEQAGLEVPKAGWTWTDLVVAAKALTQGDVKGIGFEPSLNRFAPFIWQAGGDVVDDPDRPRRISLLGRADREALGFLTDLQNLHRVMPSVGEQEAEDPESRFASGRLGMLIESRRAATALRNVDGLEWDVAPLPLHPRRRQPAVMLHSDAYCMAKASEAKEAGVRFVRFAIGGEGAPILARTGRTVPSSREVSESPAFLDPTQPPPSGQVFLDQIEHIRRFPTIAGWHEIESKADTVIEEWFYGGEPAEALDLEIDILTGELFRGG